MKINFFLSGMGDAALENSIRKAVNQAGYCEQELSDIREPAQYSLLDIINNPDDKKLKLLILQQLASLEADIAIPRRITNIKTLLKKIFAKFFKWCADPVFASQSRFNHAASSLISELVFSVQTQKDTINQLQKELNEIREKNV